MGLLPRGIAAAAGSVRWRGGEVLGLPERRRRALRGGEMAMIFQEPLSCLNPVLRVGTQIGEALRLHAGLGRRAARRRAAELLDEVGVPDPRGRLDAYPHELSGGLRQRALIATALAGDPALLVADEPTTALDVTIQAQVLELLARLRDRRGLGILLITHDLGLVAELGDTVSVLYAGQVVESAPAAVLLARPAHPYTRGLLASLPRVEGAGGPLPAIPGSVPGPGPLPPGCRFRPRCAEAAAGCEREQALAGAGERALRCHRAEAAP
jgi:oligopeptide/dipeptide ABC transporter ATP-binding protein